jgi:hypothetical protein
MIDRDALKSNFLLHDNKMTIDFFADNMRPVAIKTSVRYVSLLVLKKIFKVPVSNAAEKLRLHRSSYYGVREILDERLMLDEDQLVDLFNEEYHFDTILKDLDCSNLKRREKEMKDVLRLVCIEKMRIDEDLFEEIFKLHEDK